MKRLALILLATLGAGLPAKAQVTEGPYAVDVWIDGNHLAPVVSTDLGQVRTTTLTFGDNSLTLWAPARFGYRQWEWNVVVVDGGLPSTFRVSAPDVPILDDHTTAVYATVREELHAGASGLVTLTPGPGQSGVVVAGPIEWPTLCTTGPAASGDGTVVEDWWGGEPGIGSTGHLATNIAFTGSGNGARYILSGTTVAMPEGQGAVVLLAGLAPLVRIRRRR